MRGGFRVGNTLAIAFRVWARNPLRFIALTALLYVPLIVWAVSYELPALRDLMFRFYELAIDLPPVLRDMLNGAPLLFAIATAAITHGTVVALTGRPAPVGRAARTALGRLLPLAGLALVAVSLNSLLVNAVISLAGPYWTDPLLYAAWMLGDAILSSLFFLAIPIATLERRGVLASIARGFSLARGAQLRVFAIVALIHFAGWGISELTRLALVPEPPSLGGSSTTVAIYVCVSLVTNVALSALFAVINAVTYHQLREAREGVSVDELARVFE